MRYEPVLERRLAELCGAFERCTGWKLNYAAGKPPSHDLDLLWSAPVNPGVGTALGHFRIERVGESSEGITRTCALAPATELAGAVTELFAGLLRTRRSLWEREAELAAGVPVVPHRHEAQHLATRLQAVLQGAADAIGCQASALYTLDGATTELKLRSCWGLPWDRLTTPPRPLSESIADLESLAGHAVVLERPDQISEWNVPEAFSAAVCVPVSSPTVPLGTLWVFSTTPRPFSDREVNLAEIVAGRLASDLERERLLAEGIEGAALRRQLARAERTQQSQLPHIAPLLDGWDVAGWTTHAGAVGGNFHDWFVSHDDLLTVVAGDCLARGVEGALCASTVRGVLRAHAHGVRETEQLVDRANRTIWASSAGDLVANLCCVRGMANGARLRIAQAGQLGVLRLTQSGWESLSRPSLALGLDPSARFEFVEPELPPGGALVLLSDGVRHAPDADGRPLGESQLAELLVQSLECSASQLVDLVRDRLESHAPGMPRDDRTVLILKRR